MGRITSGVGLVSGLDYATIIQQLMAFEQKPIDLLSTRLNQQTAVSTVYTGLSATVLSLSLSVNQFGQSSVLNARQASSSNPAVLSATAASTAVLGTYTFRPLKQAQAQRYSGTGFATNKSLVGAGTVSIKRGGYVTADTPLEALNGGAGVKLGKIRVVDRSGASAVVDLAGARDVNDVITAINDNGVAAVTASVSGDAIVLTDHTGSTSATLSVQEIGLGTTAADLGLVGSVAADVKTGTDIVRLGESLKLGYVNDGLGVRRQGTLDDLRITLKDGNVVDVNLASAKTIGEVVTAINADAQNGGNVTASISGDRLVLTDNTGGGGTLSVSALNGSGAAADLGILGDEQAGGVLTGKRILAGLNSTLLGNLRGGQGISVPGQIEITDRTGASATVDLTAAESLSDVITAINASGLAVNAAVNAQGHGLVLTDTSGATTSNLIVADVAAGTTAADLGLVADVAATSIRSGDLHRRYINEATKLASLNGGSGITQGSFKITDKSGGTAIINVSGTTFQTVGDVIAAVNASAVGVHASINTTGDGILLTDTSGGGGTFSVEDLSGGRTANDLRIRSTATSGGTTIDGAYTYNVELDADDTLDDALAKLKGSGAPITASLLNTGGVDPLKLIVGSNKSGAVGRLLIDSGDTGLGLAESQRAQDAVLEMSGAGADPILFSSSLNAFSQTVQGVLIELNGTSTAPVTVTISDDSSALKGAINQFVSTFNSIASSLKKQTAFDSATVTRGTLQGEGAAVQLQSTLFNLVSRRYGSGTGTIRTFTQLGVTVTGGQLSFDEAKFAAALSADPAGVRDFFAATDSGAAAVMKKAVGAYTDSGTGILFQRIEALDRDVEDLQDRIDRLNEGLERKRLALETQFALMEKTLSQVQSQQSSLTALANLAAASFNNR